MLPVIYGNHGIVTHHAVPNSTFLGIIIQQASSGGGEEHANHDDLAAAVLGKASGILGTTVKPAELVRKCYSALSWEHCNGKA